MTLKIEHSTQRSYNPDYKLRLYTLWYNSGKPSAKQFRKSIVEPDPYVGTVPAVSILSAWIHKEWGNAAQELDVQVNQQLEQTMVMEKLEVLKRHADIAKKMQDMAITYLDEHGPGSSRNAIEMLVKGLDIERNSIGAPSQLARISEMSNEDLMDELKRLVSDNSSIIDIAPGE